ncbi:MAG TPA: carboxymuconolactone decarboxylase family protein [Edaphobacter sp.]
MFRIAPVVASNADSKVAATLAQVKASLGMVPNLFATMANSPAALDGYLGLKKTLSRGRLTDRQREIVSLAVAQVDECKYCLSAHTYLSKAAGVSDVDALKARRGEGDDEFECSLASFARTVMQKRGHVSDEEMENARKAGIDDGLVMEIVANIALNTLTNYVNEVAKTEIDFPVVEVKL